MQNLHEIDQQLLNGWNSQMLSWKDASLKLDKDSKIQNPVSQYNPTEDEKSVLAMVRRDFADSFSSMWRPRREFNDLSVVGRTMVDQMGFNTYQPNNGDPFPGDVINGWKSNAMRPVIRNKCISIAAHATARLIFPKVFAYNNQSEEQQDAATTMRDLMEYAGESMDYSYLSLKAVLTALWSPASIVYTGYQETLKTVKREKDEKGNWKPETVLDEDNCGFFGEVVSVPELFIENFYEHNIQKQGYLIWRRVKSYSNLASKYAMYPNFKYVTPGVQNFFDDANNSFYEDYDSNQRQNLCEELLYWNKSMDLFLVVVNGVLLTSFDNPNPREDKKYPFAKFGFELLDEGRFFYYKSLAFKLMQDSNVINTLYPMFIDGSYLSLFPPMVNRGGGDVMASEVMIPGSVTTLTSPDSTIQPVFTNPQGVAAGLNAIREVEKSIADSMPEAVDEGNESNTAYELSLRAKEARIVLGQFTNMIENYVRQLGPLMMGDILQYLTIADATKITEDSELIYQTFLVPDRRSSGKSKTRKIVFDADMPDEEVEEDYEKDASFDVLEEGGGEDSETELYKVNPRLFRELKFMVRVSPDIVNPMSEELERAFGLELYDRAINNQFVDQEAITRDFLLGTNPKSSHDPDKYMKSEDMSMMTSPMAALGAEMGARSPAAAMGKVTGSPIAKMASGEL